MLCGHEETFVGAGPQPIHGAPWLREDGASCCWRGYMALRTLDAEHQAVDMTGLVSRGRGC